MEKQIKSSKATFGSRWGMAMVLIGTSIGPAAFWRFPRMVGQYGGGTYVCIFILAAFLWAIPLLIAEGAIGKGSRFGVVGAFRTFLGQKNIWVAGWILITVLMMTAYFNVIGGWCMKYSWLALTGKFKAGLNGVEIFNKFTSNPVDVVFWHLVMVITTAAVLYAGVVQGIERASKLMMPALFILTIVCVIWAIILPGGIKGLDFLFAIQPKYFLNSQTWLQAFTQIAWATGAGWGLILTYAVYSRNEDSPGTNAFTVVFGGSTAGIIAAMAVIPTVYATVQDPALMQEIFNSGNQGLTFMVMPELFAKMPFGSLVGFFFFLAVVFAFLTCQFACLEFFIRLLMDIGWNRKKACVVSAIVIFALGLPSAMSVRFLNNQDWSWGIGLMLTAVFISWAIMKRGVDCIREKVVNTIKENNIYIGKWWNIIIRTIPIMFVILFGWWIYQSITWYPDTWWDPFEESTVGTMLAQWAIALIFAILIKDKLNKWTKPIPPILEQDPSLIVGVKPLDEINDNYTEVV